MIKYIEKLQSKDEMSRKQILASSLIVLMSFVGVVWISSLGYKFGDNSDKVEVVKEEKASDPFALLGNVISDTYNNITASVGDISSKKDNIKKENSDKQIDLIVVEKE